MRLRKKILIDFLRPENVKHFLGTRGLGYGPRILSWRVRGSKLYKYTTILQYMGTVYVARHPQHKDNIPTNIGREQVAAFADVIISNPSARLISPLTIATSSLGRTVSAGGLLESNVRKAVPDIEVRRAVDPQLEIIKGKDKNDGTQYSQMRTNLEAFIAERLSAPGTHVGITHGQNIAAAFWNKTIGRGPQLPRMGYLVFSRDNYKAA